MQRAGAKVMVLAAGLGTRLEPLTDELPKPLVPLGDRSLLEHVLDRLRTQGLMPVAVNSFHRSALFRSIASAFDGIFAIVDEPELRGTAGGVAGALDVLAPGPVLVTNADVLSSVDFSELRARTPAGGLCLAVVPRARGEGTLGLGAGGRVVRLRGERFGDELEGGDYVGTLGIGAELRAGLPARGCLIGDVALPLARSGAVLATVPVPGVLVAPGDSLAGYLAENLAWLAARGERSYTGPSARVSAGVELDRAIVGAGATVDGAGRLERVVVWPGARAVAPLADAVVTTAGRVVNVRPTPAQAVR